MGKMAEAQRKLLEQMMGPEAMGVVQLHVDWWDPKVCRNFLCGTCPHLIFTNTKMDIGPCPKLHQDAILTAFNLAKTTNPQDPRFFAFEQEYQNNIYAFVEDCDRKIRMSQRRLEKTPEENAKTVNLMKEIGEIELSIQGETEEIEQLGEAGKVEESMAKLAAVEALKGEKADKERELQHLTETGGASGHQKLRVCETCGAYLSVLDSDRRLADHFGGKMHLGYHELRKLLEAFNEQRAARLAGNMGGQGGYGPRGGNQQQQQQQQQNFAPPPPPGAPGAPRGPSSANAPPPPPPPPAFPVPSDPSTPVDRKPVPELGELIDDAAVVPGHGEKRKREALELMSDVKSERSREDDRERERDRDRERRHRETDAERAIRKEKEKEREHRHRDDRERSSRHDDKYRSSRSERSDRERERGGEERSSKRERSDRDKSRSPRRR